MKLPDVFERYRQDIDAELKSVLFERNSPLYDLMKYHFGWIDENGQPQPGSIGKALRPTLCLLACEAVGGDYHQALPAAAALESCQNREGGWGETCQTYDDPRCRGAASSTISQTAWALLGLIAAGEYTGSAARKGVQYLLETQREDGSWYEAAYTGTGVPRVFYLKYELYPVYFSLLALGRYRSVLRGEQDGDGNA